MNGTMKSACATGPLVVCLLFAQATGASGRKPQARVPDTKQEVMNFERGWWEAYAKRDRAALERILADEFLGFDTDTGDPETKTQWIDGAMAKNYRVDSYSIERIDVVVVADTAVAAVHFTAHYTVDGKSRSSRSIDLDTLVRRNGRWQAVATGEVQPTPPK